MPRSRRALALAAAGGALYGAYIARRNGSILRPPLRDPDGEMLPAGRFRYSDGETVSYMDVGPLELPDGVGEAGSSGGADEAVSRPGAAGAAEDAAHGAGGVPAAPPVSTLLLIPGADGLKETFRYQLPALARRHRVVAADLRARFPGGEGLDRFVADTVELLDALAVGPVVVVGQSLGGAIAMRLATMYPDRLRALVVANTLTRLTNEHAGLKLTTLTPIAILTTRFLPTPLARAAARAWSRTGVWIFDDSPGWANVVDYALWTGPRTVPMRVSNRRVRRLIGVDLRPDLPSIRVPTLVIDGARDTYTPSAWSLEIARLVPCARYVAIPDAGHCAHISMPGEFNRILLEWLRDLAPREIERGPPEIDSSTRQEIGRPPPQETEA